MAKTKIFWIAKKVDDTMQMWGYNNKRKAEEKGLELYGVGITDFSFKLDGEEFEDEDGDTAFIYSGQIDSFGHFLLYRADGMPGAIGLEQERAATEYVEAELPNSAGACFSAKLKGGSCDVYMSSAVEANGAMWTFEDGEVNEQKETKTTMRHIHLFEQFINEKVNIKKEIKKIADYYDDTETSGTEIYVKDYVEDENVSSHGYMFWWNAEDQECGIEYQKTAAGDESDDPCKTADDFITYVNSRT